MQTLKSRYDNKINVSLVGVTTTLFLCPFFYAQNNLFLVTSKTLWNSNFSSIYKLEKKCVP